MVNEPSRIMRVALLTGLVVDAGGSAAFARTPLGAAALACTPVASVAVSSHDDRADATQAAQRMLVTSVHPDRYLLMRTQVATPEGFGASEVDRVAMAPLPVVGLTYTERFGS